MVNTKSTRMVNPPKRKMEIATMTVEPFSSSQVGQVHFLNSSRVCWMYAVNRAKWPARHRKTKTANTAAAQIIVQTVSDIT